MFWSLIFGFLSTKEHPAKTNFKNEEITQIIHFLFLPPCLIENSIGCFAVSSSPSTIRLLSLRLGKGLWHSQQQGKCFNSPVNSTTEVYCYRTDTEGKAAAACTGHLLCLEDQPLEAPSPSKAQDWLSREREHSNLDWDLETRRAGLESRICDLWQIT